jgi:hypothetical protein
VKSPHRNTTEILEPEEVIEEISDDPEDTEQV